MTEPNKPDKVIKGKEIDDIEYILGSPKRKKKLKSPKLGKKQDSGIPKPVANRMARRIAVLTGIPTFTGMAVFVLSYLAVSKGMFDIPPIITLITSAGCFLIGLIGLSYGMLSASWEDSPGSLLGLENIQPNITRMRSAFQTPKKTEPSK